MARIRTIKPEFWLSESLAGLSEHARLLAIALLNHSDDCGYFLANHHLVKAACFPFQESSSNVLGSLQELSGIGYIEIRECDGKSIGHICKFLDHQRINKPQKSKLEPIFCSFASENSISRNATGTLPECYRNTTVLEQGTGSMEVEHGSGTEELEVEHGKEFSLSVSETETGRVDYSSDFDKFWEVYPKQRRTKKQEAYRKWKQALKRADSRLLIQRALDYSNSDQGRSEFAVMPSVWLNGAMWEDSAEAWVRTSKTTADRRLEGTEKAIREFVNG